MRLAIFSDVHGNYHALEAVLADIDAHRPFDHIVFAGDLVYGAADPIKCIAALQARGILAVYGNTDEFLWKPPTIPEDTNPQEKTLLLDLIAWFQARIGENGLAYLRGLPFDLRFSPLTGQSTTLPIPHDLLVVHANPHNVYAPIFPPEERQKTLRGKIVQPDSAVEPLLEGVSAEMIAYGHVHVPSVRRIGGTGGTKRHLLANIASVSRPYDGDWRAKYGILTFEDGSWHIQHRYVEYDVAAARASILESDMPNATGEAESLLLPASPA